MCESFFHTLQLELLDQHHWTSRNQLAQAVFEWIETWYNQSRRHSSIEMLSPIVRGQSSVLAFGHEKSPLLGAVVMF